MNYDKIITAVVILLCLLTIVNFGLIISVYAKSEHLVSFRDFPGQKMATPALLASMTNGYNKNSDASAEDPYLKAMLDISSTDNAWTTANWKV
jgi:hypothetical protein